MLTCPRCLDRRPSVWTALYKWLKGKSKSTPCVSSSPHASSYIRLPVHMLTATVAVVQARLAAAASIKPHIRTPVAHLISHVSVAQAFFKTNCHPSLNMSTTIHPSFHHVSPLSLPRWHYLLPTSQTPPPLWAQWVVNPHTNNMVPVAIISLESYGEGEEIKGQRKGEFQECKGESYRTYKWKRRLIKIAIATAPLGRSKVIHTAVSVSVYQEGAVIPRGTWARDMTQGVGRTVRKGGLGRVYN